MPAALEGHELVAHHFLLLGEPEHHRVTREMWERITDEFALTAPIPPHPAELPVEPPAVADGESVLAARAGRAPGKQQAVARRVHDVLVLSYVCAPSGDPGWAGFADRWQRVLGEPSPTVLGSVRILQARLAGAGAMPAELDPRELPGVPAPRRWIGGVVEPEARLGALGLWEALDEHADPAVLDARRHRDLVVVAPADGDPQMSSFTWSRGDPRLTPFANYLLHAAKLRYAARTRTATVRALPRLRAVVDRARDELTPVRRAGRPLTGASATAARAALAALAAADLDLAVRETLLTELRDAVAAAETNLGLYAGRDRTAEPFADDRAVSVWLQDQLGRDLRHVAGPRTLHRDLAAAIVPLVPPVGEDVVPQKAPVPSGSALRDALMAAHPRYELLEMLLDERLGRPLPRYSQPDRMDVVLHRVISAARSEGWLNALVTEALRGNPGNPQLKALVESGMFDLDTALTAARDGEITALADVHPPPAAFVYDGDPAVLEHVVRSFDGFQNPWVFWAGLEAGARRVCLVDTATLRAEGGGTGFLVGSDLVLTNHHVVAGLIAAAAPASSVRCVFDHAIDATGGIGDDVRVGLADDWLVAASPPSAVDRLPGHAGLPGRDELDYALIRLAAPVPDPATGGPRGWYDLLAAPPTLQQDQTLLVLQHPAGQRLKIAFGPVVAVNANHTRVTHRVNTLSGSSGGPCLTLDMRLAALHHAGTPRDRQAGPTAKLNAAVPVEAIVRHLDDTGRAGVLPDAAMSPNGPV